MSEVLSQSQIDALLASVGSGEAPPQEQDTGPVLKARKYDFLAPKKFTKDSLRILDSIYNNFARMVQTTLSGMLRMNCEVELLDIEEQKYNEFNNALNDNDVLSVISFRVDEDNYHDQPILMQISSEIIFIMLDRMMGGLGLPSDEDFRGYTEIELTVLDNINNHLAPLMNDVWQSYFAVNIQFDRMEENPRLMQDISIDDTVVIVVLNISLRDISGTINICLPGESLEALFKTFEDRRRVPGGRLRDSHRKSEDATETILTNISGSTLELTVKLGDAQVSLGDVFQLRVGDIINLNKPRNSDALLYVEDVPWFTGELGVQKHNKALKIKGPIQK